MRGRRPRPRYASPTVYAARFDLTIRRAQSLSFSLSFTKPADGAPSNEIDGFDPDVLGGSSGFSVAEAEAAGRSLHVGYEDPGQHAEKKKLMKLLTTHKKEPWELDEADAQPAPVAKARKGPAPRRRTRNPGF